MDSPGRLNLTGRVWTGLALGALTGLALILRAWGLGAPSVTHDEAYGLWVATRPLAEVLPATAHDVHPPLYYLLLHAWLALGPHSDTWARLPSALMGTALVPLMYALGRRLWDTGTGLVAALLATLSPLAVAQAREARMYPPVTLLLALAAYALLHTVAGRRLRWWAASVFLSLLALYTHYYAVFVLVAFLTYCIFPFHNTKLVSRFTLYACLLSIASCLLFYSPWLPMLFDQLSRVRAGFWIPPPSPQEVGKVAQALAFYAVTPRPPTATPEDLAVKVVGAGCVVVALLIALIYDHRPQTVTGGFVQSDPGADAGEQSVTGGRGCAVWLPTLWLIIPVALAYVVSLVGPSVFEPRYFAVCLPAFWLLVARGTLAWPGRALKMTLLTGLLVAALASLYTLFTYPACQPPDTRSAAAWLRERHAPAALVIHTSQFSLRPIVWYNGDDKAGVLADDPAIPARLDSLVTASRFRLVVHYDVRRADGPRQADANAAAWAASHGLWNLRTVARFWGIHVYEWANGEMGKWADGQMGK